MKNFNCIIIFSMSFFALLNAGFFSPLITEKNATLIDTNPLHNKKLYKDDFKELGIEYIDHLDTQMIDIAIPPISDEFLAAFKHITQQYGSLVAAHHEVPMYLKFIDDAVGYGIFAEREIQRGEMVGEYTGLLLSYKQQENYGMYESAYSWSIAPTLRSNDQSLILCVDARIAGNFMRYVNHSFTPNVTVAYVPVDGLWHTIYVAIKTIKKDEELLVDYGMGYWMGRNKWPRPQSILKTLLH